MNLQLAAKYLFVRILRDSPHLQSKTKTHWGVWLGSSIGVGIVGFIVAEAIPFFGTLLGLVGSVCFTPLAVIFPMTFWLYDHWHYKNGSLGRKLFWAFHILFIFIGLL